MPYPCASLPEGARSRSGSSEWRVAFPEEELEGRAHSPPPGSREPTPQRFRGWRREAGHWLGSRGEARPGQGACGGPELQGRPLQCLPLRLSRNAAFQALLEQCFAGGGDAAASSCPQGPNGGDIPAAGGSGAPRASVKAESPAALPEVARDGRSNREVSCETGATVSGFGKSSGGFISSGCAASEGGGEGRGRE